MTMPRVDDDAPDPPKALVAVKSPKYVVFPVVAIVM